MFQAFSIAVDCIGSVWVFDVLIPRIKCQLRPMISKDACFDVSFYLRCWGWLFRFRLWCCHRTMWHRD